MSEPILTMRLYKEKYGVCRLNNDEPIPAWCLASGFFSITRTDDELSIVCEQADIPDSITCENNWRLLKVLGPLDFSLVGILSRISKVLADESISIFAISTYDTDYILLKDKDIDTGVTALTNAGYEIIN